jgi:hypothetical protein
MKRTTCSAVTAGDFGQEFAVNRSFAAFIVLVTLTGCTSDPDAAVNQTFPVRQMDNFFRSLSGPPPAQQYSHAPGYLPPDQEYIHEPGYAPAYPSY